jgi:Uma2 family endonuclease
MAIPAIPRSLDFPDLEKPYIESIRGTLVPKMSPRRTHALLQARLTRWLEDWAGERGEVGTEWRFYFLPKQERPSSLVPDVAYVSFERLPRTLPPDARERPRVAPDIAVEILSPGDSARTTAEKVGLYLENGSCAVILVDTKTRSVGLYRRDGTETATEGATMRVVPFEGLILDTGALFRGL